MIENREHVNTQFIDFITKTSMPPISNSNSKLNRFGKQYAQLSKEPWITKNCHFVPVCYYLMFLSFTALICEMG